MSDQGGDLVYKYGQWQIHLGRRELLADGVSVPIGVRAFEIIEVLVRSANNLVTKNELMGRIWPGATVEENTLQVHISAIRKAFGPDRGMVKTLSGRGYRLIGNWIPRQQTTATASAALPLMHEAGAPAEHNFPLIAERLIGRNAAVHHVRDLISAYRVVTLAGPGGIGKTSLAIEAARGLAAQFDDGGWFVELASLSNPDLVSSTVASALGLQLGGEASAERVARATGNKHLLLVLDNCEHVIDAAAEVVERFLGLCPRATILATSRETLRTHGETVYRVPPLGVPPLGPETRDNILTHSSVELFLARTTALDMGVVPSAEQLTAVAAICRRLDGIPLAIELAAASAATLGITQVALGLHDRFALLTRGRRTALARQRTLRATLDWSHELLPEVEQRLFRRLGVFNGGFTLDAAIAVMDNGGLNAAAVMNGVEDLVAKSLIMLDKSEEGGRWHLLETTRAYALEKLEESGEVQHAARRHAEFYQALFAPFATAGQVQAAIDDLKRYNVEVDNLRGALNWALSPGGDAGVGVSLAAVAADFWAVELTAGEARDWSGKALAQIGDAVGTRREMILQCSFGMTLLLTRGVNDDAREALTRALTLAREFADFDYQQRVTYNLWQCSLRSSALDDALAMARHAEDAPGFDDAQSRATVDCWIGITQIYRGVHVEAIERIQRAIDRYPVEQNRPDVVQFGLNMPAMAGVHVAVSLMSRGLLDTASRSAADAVEQARSTRRPASLCAALAWAAGYIFLSLDELEKAESYSDELIRYAFEHTMRAPHAIGLCVRGSLLARRGDPEAGINLIRQGISDMHALNYGQFYPFFAVALATVLGAMHRIDDGLTDIDAALRFAADTGHQWFVPEILRAKCQLLALRDPDEPATETCFNRGIEVAREQNALFWELRLATSLARLRITQSREREAREILAPVYHQFTEGFAIADLRAARAVLDELPS